MIQVRLRQGAFETFHREHPEIYKEFSTMCYELWHSDVRGYSASGILAVIRYNRTLSRQAPLKLESSFGTRYAEMLREEDERFVNFFGGIH